MIAMLKPNVRNLHILEQDQQPPLSSGRGDLYAVIGSELSFDAHIFDSYCFEGWSKIHHDLLVISAAVEYADRRWARGDKQWCRSMHITIPVYEIDAWQDASINKSLVEALSHLTGDRWNFSFVRCENSPITDGRQLPLFPNYKKEFAIAYSDGLDSLCVSGIFNKGDVAVCVRVSKYRQRVQKSQNPFDRLPFDVRVKPSSENSARSRGFKFAAITAIAAHLSGVTRIVVPESGQGALGPVLVPLINIYPDYRNHPTFFRRMEKFIFVLLGVSLQYEQPRLWNTKGQTIGAFLAEPDNNVAQLRSTRSCWQQRFNVRIDGHYRQCGICAACLLRRMSLQAVDVEEDRQTYTINNIQVKNYMDAIPKDSNCSVSKTLYEYGCIGSRHLQQLADLSTAPETILKPYAFELAEALEISTQLALSQIKTLLNQHRDEWQKFLSAQGESSFLNVWIKGGRYDGFK